MHHASVLLFLFCVWNSVTEELRTLCQLKWQLVGGNLSTDVFWLPLIDNLFRVWPTLINRDPPPHPPPKGQAVLLTASYRTVCSLLMHDRCHDSQKKTCSYFHFYLTWKTSFCCFSKSWSQKVLESNIYKSLQSVCMKWLSFFGVSVQYFLLYFAILNVSAQPTTQPLCVLSVLEHFFPLCLLHHCPDSFMA